jgi:asparagine N-glycosylation enzyme membrane subunit Stt3
MDDTCRTIDRRWVLLGVVLFIGLNFNFVLNGSAGILDGAFVDPDCYMRLNRVIALSEGASWFDASEPLINPPQGHEQHWTRPLDVLLLVGARLISPFLGFPAALHSWAVAMSPLLGIITIFALAWAVRPVLDRRAQAVATLAFVVQPGVFAAFVIGRPDHHGLLLLLFVLHLGLTACSLARQCPTRTACMAGAIAALAIWISVESLVFVGAGLAALALAWVINGQPFARRCFQTTAATALALGAALLMERGFGNVGVIEADRISIVHLALFATIAMFWGIIAEGEQKGLAVSPAIARLAAGVVAAGITGLVLLTLFPVLATGPLGPVNALYNELRLQRIQELQPIVNWQQLLAGNWQEQVHSALIQAGIALVAVPQVALRVYRSDGDNRRIWLFIAIALFACLVLMVREIRWSPYGQALLVIPFGYWLASVAQHIHQRLAATVSPRVAAVAVLSLVFVGIDFPHLAARPFESNDTADASAYCPIKETAALLSGKPHAAESVILAVPEFGPEILYRSPFAVLSIPNHRPQPGFATTIAALAADDDAEAHDLLARHRVAYVMLCPTEAEAEYLAQAGDKQTLYRRLVDGAPPPWLRPIDEPAVNRAGLKVFAVAGGLTPTVEASSR